MVADALTTIKAIISAFRFGVPFNKPSGLLRTCSWIEGLSWDAVRRVSDEALKSLALGAFLGYLVGGVRAEQTGLSAILETELAGSGYWETEIPTVSRGDPRPHFRRHQVDDGNSSEGSDETCQYYVTPYTHI